MKAGMIRLSEAHQQIKSLAALLGRRLSEPLKEAGDTDSALKIAVKLRTVLERYIPTEERLLRLLEGHLEAGQGSLSLLSEEHKLILSTLDELIATLRRSSDNKAKARKSPKTLSRRLIETLSNHLSKEENVVYWLADLHLSEAEKRDLIRRKETTRVSVK